jgi:hypothetical protein
VGSIPDGVIGIFIDTGDLHMSIALKSGILNHLELSGLVQACNGIAVPLLIRPSWRNRHWEWRMVVVI